MGGITNVPYEERPEQTPENIPDELVEKALGMATSYGECLECGHRFWHLHKPGHNQRFECPKCGNKILA